MRAVTRSRAGRSWAGASARRRSPSRHWWIAVSKLTATRLASARPPVVTSALRPLRQVLDDVGALAGAHHALAARLALERGGVAQGGAARAQLGVLPLEGGDLGAAVLGLLHGGPVRARG